MWKKSQVAQCVATRRFWMSIAGKAGCRLTLIMQLIGLREWENKCGKAADELQYSSTRERKK